MAERALAIDPGENVGWAHGDLSEDLVVTGHGITAWPDFVKKLGEVAGEYDTIIYETFRLRADKARKLVGSDFQTVQCIGVIRYFCWLNPSVKLVSQGPSVKKTGFKIAPPGVRAIVKLLPAAHDDSHDGDALAHLSYYWWKQYV